MKKHYCTAPGCGKSFSRPSHLQRHAWNHSKSQWICNRCNASFKRLDLLERHKARHASKDRRAGGVGLGILGTKSKYLNRDLAAHRGSGTSPRLSASRNHEMASVHAVETPIQDRPSNEDTIRETVREELSTHVFDPEPAMPLDVPNHESENEEIGNMYHDMTFDLVHFNVTGFAAPMSNNDLQTTSAPCVNEFRNSPKLGSTTTPCQDKPDGRVDDATVRDDHAFSDRNRNAPLILIPVRKRNEVVELITEIRPVRPDGSLVNGDAPDLSLEKMQTCLNLFLDYFNSSYPLLHVPSLDICNLDPIALLSFIIMGATYRDKDAHQLSVCLYDAIIPYIFGGLLSSMVPDLTILQAFMVLECYGMYRAGPYQRENAIFIHSLLLNSVSRISRYHVQACITLPGRLAHAERDWLEFAYAEQYKRLILFFFMWDTQNATCYSFMPNMSTQSLHLELPCSKQLWEAQSESEWRRLATDPDDSCTFLNLVEEFIDSTYRELSRPYNMLGFSLALHGLMSICNDIILFDSRSRYFNMLKRQESNWFGRREQMAYALSSWKAKYEAFAMDAQRDMGTELERNRFHRDNTGLYALYHTAHIVLNCEIRHIQIAAGARAIFGHVVTHTDFEDSCNWMRNWLRNSADSAGRAAWHAAQLFREAMLSLKIWDVNGIFHYPWCLYIATLTCWAYHQFGAEMIDEQEEGAGVDITRLRSRACGSQTCPARTEALRRRSRTSMHHLVATMASVTPAYMDILMGKCCTHGLMIEMTKYLRSIRWTAAYEAMRVLEGLCELPGEEQDTANSSSYET
ncbi:fungal-specific transcription factor domain-containing protein [Aspergillus cavernicola]|uniref:Fungal-specific transcription factor domain-containing protein n=1 Tax=Aspergillus cavernicola TaxID=176166 RepID=A0ABR4IDE6_9EURO